MCARSQDRCLPLAYLEPEREPLYSAKEHNLFQITRVECWADLRCQKLHRDQQVSMQVHRIQVDPHYITTTEPLCEKHLLDSLALVAFVLKMLAI